MSKGSSFCFLPPSFDRQATLHHPDREPRLPSREPLKVIIDKLEFAVGD